MISKDYIAALILFALTTSFGLFLILFNPTLFTYILGGILTLSGTLVLVLKHVFMCIKPSEPLDVV
jgi:hypothetical protein